MEVLMLYKGLSKVEVFEELVKMFDVVKMLEVCKCMKMFLYEFFGGMCQCVMIVMVLLCWFWLLIVDELIIVLDVIVQVQIMMLLNEFKCEFNMVIIMIIYDFGVVVGICDKVLVMYVGCIMEYGQVCDVFY